ncbi:MAG: DoxX family protein [Gemmatimonadales bacterium]
MDMHALTLITNTQARFAPVVIRLVLGIVMFPHGAQHLFGWYGGSGFQQTLAFFSGAMGLPAFLGALIVFAEFFGAVALIVGAFSRIAALAIGVVMLGAVWMVHAPNGFFMNWIGTQPGEGFEYHLLVLGLVTAILIAGSGALSIDRVIASRLGRSISTN